MTTAFLEIGAPPPLDPALSREAVRRALAEAFSAEGIESPGLDARLLLCAALGIEHADLVRDPDLPLGAGASALRDFARRRLRGEPVSRILGRREFRGALLEIDAEVLDPRPDTETLVDAVVTHLAADPPTDRRILDLGVGSGAILCALLLALPDAFGVGVDLAFGACRVTRGNMTRLGLSARGAIFCGSWADALRGPYDVIVSNPPYIATKEIDGLAREVRDHDPRLALDGGNDGLDSYRAIAPLLEPALAEKGLVALEIGAGQKTEVAAILLDAGLEPFDVRRDLGGRERVILARKARESFVARAAGFDTARPMDPLPLPLGATTYGSGGRVRSVAIRSRQRTEKDIFGKGPWRLRGKRLGSFARDHLFAPDGNMREASRPSCSDDDVVTRGAVGFPLSTAPGATGK